MARQIRSTARLQKNLTPAEEEFEAREDHRSYLSSQGQLPDGFKTSVGSFGFNPVELPTLSTTMAMTLIVPDEPTDSFAAMFTSNAIAGHPVHVGRDILADSSAKLGGIVINNKISNVGAPGGKEHALTVTAAVARELGLESGVYVLPSSTGVIGWQIPSGKMVDAVPSLVDGLKAGSFMPAAEGIMTTDLYPKLRAAAVEGTEARIVGIAKGAGMVEPNLATMLVYILTDADVPREHLDEDLRMAVGTTFNCLSIDQDQSTSDTVVAVSSRKHPCEGPAARDAFRAAMLEVCGRLAMDVVRNGEGIQHVIQVAVRRAPTRQLAVDVGRSIVNSPLFKTAVAGNDPNVGRLLMAVGKAVGPHADTPDEFRTGTRLADAMTASVGGTAVFENGRFALSSEKEQLLKQHFLDAQMWSESGVHCIAMHRRARSNPCRFPVKPPYCGLALYPSLPNPPPRCGPPWPVSPAICPSLTTYCHAC